MSAAVTGYSFPMCNVTKVLCISMTQCILIFPCLPFPAENRALTPVGYKYDFDVDIFCVCRLPEHVGGDEWAECEGCLKWFHRHCLDIPESVFDVRQESPNCRNHTA